MFNFVFVLSFIIKSSLNSCLSLMKFSVLVLHVKFRHFSHYEHKERKGVPIRPAIYPIKFSEIDIIPIFLRTIYYNFN